MDVGAKLREARERRAISLDDLAQTTKIRVANLRAIETNRRHELPETIFLRGFVRAYAREVGLDPGDIVSRYLEQFEPVANVVQASASESKATEPRQMAPDPVAIVRHERRAVLDQWLFVVMVLVVGLVGYNFSGWSYSDEAPEIARSTHPTSDRPEVGTSGSQEPAATRSADGDVLHLEIRAEGSCWLTATADGTRVMYRLMEPGERLALDVHQEAVLRVGDPAAFAFSIDGMAGRSLGPGGEPVTAHITAANYREFLRR